MFVCSVSLGGDLPAIPVAHLEYAALVSYDPLELIAFCEQTALRIGFTVKS